MLWAITGRARLLIPIDLWRLFDDEQRVALLAHEMAHLKRRDHWVRWLELVAGVIWWWHPVVWWGRRELREAEEQCCDAWVLWAMPQAARTYATALLDTVDFVSETGTTPALGASSAGAAKDLKRRLVMIMKASNPKSLSSLGRIIVLAIGLIALPALPRLAAGDDDVKGKPSGEDRKKKYEDEFDKQVRKDGEKRDDSDFRRDAQVKEKKKYNDEFAKEPRKEAEPRKDGEVRKEKEFARPLAPPAEPVAGVFSRFDANAIVISDDEHDRDIRAGLGAEPIVTIDGRKASIKELRPGMPVHVSALEGSAKIEARRPRWMKADVVKGEIDKVKGSIREGEKVKQPTGDPEKVKGAGDAIGEAGKKIKGAADGEKIKEPARDPEKFKDGGDKPKIKEGVRDGEKIKGVGEGDKFKAKEGAPRDGEPRATKGKVLRGLLVKVEGGTLVLAVGDAGRETFVAINDNTKVVIDGKLARLAQLEPGMSVSVQQVEGVTTVIEARAQRPK
jgi:hypothetical protein